MDESFTMNPVDRDGTSREDDIRVLGGYKVEMFCNALSENLFGGATRS